MEYFYDEFLDNLYKNAFSNGRAKELDKKKQLSDFILYLNIVVKTLTDIQYVHIKYHPHIEYIP